MLDRLAKISGIVPEITLSESKPPLTLNRSKVVSKPISSGIVPETPTKSNVKLV